VVGQIKHVYNQTVADDPATSIVRPSDWNSVHNQTITLGGNFAGGGSTISGTGIVLAGGNNITLSADTLNQSIIFSGAAGGGQTNQTLGVYGSVNTTGQSSFATYDARSLTLDGDGIVSVGWSNNSHLIVSASQSVQTEGFYAVGNTTGQSSSTTLDARSLSFDGAGIASVGMSGGSVVISVPSAAAAAQTWGASGNTTAQSSSTTLNNVTISAAGLISAGFSAGTLVLSGVQTNQTDGVYASQNTTGNSSSLTYDARSLTIEGLGAVSVGWSTNNSHLLISAPNTIAQTNQSIGVYASSQTVGQSSSSTVDARSFTHVGQGIVSVGMSGGSLLISATTVAQTNQTEGFYAVGNTTAQSSSTTLDARTLSFDGAGIVSVGYSAGSVVISATDAAQTNQTLGIYGSVNTTGTSSSSTHDARSLTIDGDGIVSVGWSSNSHLIISASVAAQTNQSAGLYAVGNTTGQSTSTTVDARTISFDGAGIVSVGYSAGSVVISATDAAQTNQTLGIYGSGNTTGTSSSSTHDARSLSIDGDGIVSVGWSSNSHLIISASVAAQSNQTLGLYGLGNTTESSSTTVDARTLSFRGDGIVTVGFSAGSMDISASQSAQTMGLYAVGNTTTASSSTTVDARSLSFDGAGVASVGMSGGSVIISVPSVGGGNFSGGISSIGNTSGTSGTVNAQLVLAGGNNITLSGSVNGQSATVTVSAFNQSNQTEGFYAVGNTTGQSSSTTLDARTHSIDAVGILSAGYSNSSIVLSAPAAMSAWEPREFAGSFNLSLGQNSLWLIPFNVPWPMTVSRLNLLSSVSAGTGASASYAVSHTLSVALFTRDTVNTSNISTIFSTSQAGFFSGSSNASYKVSWGGASTSSAGSGLATMARGMKLATVPMATLMTPGEYWLGLIASTSSTGSNILSMSAVMAQLDAGISGSAGGIGFLVDSVFSRAWLAPLQFEGTYGTTTGAFPGTIGLTQVNPVTINTAVGNQTYGIPYFNVNNVNTL